MDCDRRRHLFPSSIARACEDRSRRLNKNSERNRGGTTTNTLTSCVRWREIHDRSLAHKWRRYVRYKPSPSPPAELTSSRWKALFSIWPRSDHNYSTKLPEFSPVASILCSHDMRFLYDLQLWCTIRLIIAQISSIYFRTFCVAQKRAFNFIAGI